MSAAMDANVLVYASNENAIEHERAREVVEHLLTGPTIDIGRPIIGNDVADAAIVAMMTANGVSTIYSRDRGFRRFDGIRVIDPFS